AGDIARERVGAVAGPPRDRVVARILVADAVRRGAGRHGRALVVECWWNQLPHRDSERAGEDQAEHDQERPHRTPVAYADRTVVRQDRAVGAHARTRGLVALALAHQ